MIFWRNEDAVSEVIGIILLVAITVIVAAVIAMYVFGVPANLTKTSDGRPALSLLACALASCYSLSRPEMSSQPNISKQMSVAVLRINGDFLRSMILASMSFIDPRSIMTKSKGPWTKSIRSTLESTINPLDNTSLANSFSFPGCISTRT